MSAERGGPTANDLAGETYENLRRIRLLLGDVAIALAIQHPPPAQPEPAGPTPTHFRDTLQYTVETSRELVAVSELLMREITRTAQEVASLRTAAGSGAFPAPAPGYPAGMR